MKNKYERDDERKIYVYTFCILLFQIYFIKKGKTASEIITNSLSSQNKSSTLMRALGLLKN